MENTQKQIDALKGDVDQVTDKLDRVLEILTSLSLPSRVDPATVGANPPIDSPLTKVVWPPFSSSSRYTSTVAQVTQEPMATNTEFMVGQPRTHQVQPGFAMPRSLEDPKNTHQGDNVKGKFVVSPSEETRQRFKAIEDKIRMTESFLPNNVSPPHSRSTVSARTPCFNHQYPTVVQPQHQPPLKEQHQPFLIKQPQSQPLLIEQHQPFLIKQPQSQPLLIEQSQPFLIKQPQPQPLLIEQPQPFLIKQPQSQPLLIEQSQPFLIKQPQPQPLLIEQPQPFLIKQP
ncbi:hypothetical protein QL285_090809 [Trifolium repens]|nr:hypothetical protein QL285_090809 [Trifolium repens]